ncbi:MAG: hypothetical protein AAFZ58_11415 [Pseudomonadota bacterium]
MPAQNHIIRQYQYELHNQFKQEAVNDNALLYLYGEDKSLLAAIAFLPDDQTLEAPEESPNGYVAVQMHNRHLQPLIDMLRNEKPVVFSWSPASSVIRVSTHKEPVGEQELKRMFRFLYI